MLLDVVILPSAKLRRKLGRKIKKAVNSIPHVFVVDNKKLIPHLSLYHIRTTKVRFDKLVELVHEIIKSYKPFKLKSKGEQTFPSGIVYYSIYKPAVLQRLHREVVDKCRILKTGPVPWNHARRPTKQETHYFKKYGSRLLLKFFKPHFTMVKLKNLDNGTKVIRKMKLGKFGFLADTVAICEVNNWLQVTKILKTFKLRAQ